MTPQALCRNAPRNAIVSRFSVRNLALPVWAGLFCLVIGVVLPWQVGAYLHNGLAPALERVAGNIQTHVRISDYRKGLWQSSARVLLSSEFWREPIELELTMRHGPWLGLDTPSGKSLGWFAIETALPSKGGISLFPAKQGVSAWVLGELGGDLHIGAALNDSRHTLGEIRLHAFMREHSRCRGELRLPGFKWLAPHGEVIVADMALRVNLQRDRGRRQGDFSTDALRAAWVFSPSSEAQTHSDDVFHALPPSVLIEQPRFDVLFAESTQFNASWSSARGVNFQALGLKPGIELGRMNTRLHWHDVDWDALWSSLATTSPSRFKPQSLNPLAYALGRGDIRLETLELARPDAGITLSGQLRARAPVLDWQDLELGLNARMDRAWLVEWIQNANLTASKEQANQQLDALLKQGWLTTRANGQLGAVLSLWHGQMRFSERRLSASDQ